MRGLLILFGALAAAGCSQSEAPKAPPGAMESFAKRQNAKDVGDRAARVEAARSRETRRAADDRQTKNADEDIARFAAAEKAMDEKEQAPAQK